MDSEDPLLVVPEGAATADLPAASVLCERLSEALLLLLTIPIVPEELSL